MVRAIARHQRAGYTAILRVIGLMHLAPHLVHISKFSLDEAKGLLDKLLAIRSLALLTPPLAALGEGLLTLKTIRRRPALRRAFGDIQAKDSERYDAFWQRYVQVYREVHPTTEPPAADVKKVTNQPSGHISGLGAPSKKVAIIGGGASGIVTAYMLAGHHEVHLFEQAPMLGGHIRTINRNVTNSRVPGDIYFENGVVTFNRLAAPTFYRLMKELDVSLRPDLISSGLFLEGRRHLLSFTRKLFRHQGLLGTARRMLEHKKGEFGYNSCFTDSYQLPANTTYSMAYNLDDLIDPARVVDRFIHTVPDYTAEAIRGRSQIVKLSGKRHTFHAGAYLGDAMQEGAIRSALTVSEALGGRSL